MKKIKKISLFITLISCLFLTGCLNSRRADEIWVGASPSPHAEILNEIASYVSSRGYTLKVKKYTDYILPNVAVSEGDLDANFFQHTPYLEWYNAENKTDLVSVLKVHYEPLGIYAGKAISLENIPNGATIGLPVDSTNFSRALLLLEQEGLIELDHKNGFELSKSDITSNPHNLNILTAEAAVLARQLSNYDFAIINGNYALSENIPLSKLLAKEAVTGLAAERYANILVVANGQENSEKTQILIDALSQESIKNFILNKYNGAVLPYTLQ